MVTPSAGGIVVVPFPFSDLSQAKLRPAVALADAGRGDWILCQVTSNPYGDPRAVHLTPASFGSGSLRSNSYARPGKLFTASRELIGPRALHRRGRQDSAQRGHPLKMANRNGRRATAFTRWPSPAGDAERCADREHGDPEEAYQ